MPEEEWIDTTAIGDAYQSQIEVNSSRRRYRRQPLTLKINGIEELAHEEEWIEGEPPSERFITPFELPSAYETEVLKDP